MIQSWKYLYFDSGILFLFTPLFYDQLVVLDKMEVRVDYVKAFPEVLIECAGEDALLVITVLITLTHVVSGGVLWVAFEVTFESSKDPSSGRDEGPTLG